MDSTVSFFAMPIGTQISNVGSEVQRALRWRKAGNRQREIAFCEKAKLDHNLLIVPGTGFGCPGHARISYCVPTEQVERSLAAFEKLVKSYK